MSLLGSLNYMLMGSKKYEMMKYRKIVCGIPYLYLIYFDHEEAKPFFLLLTEDH